MRKSPPTRTLRAPSLRVDPEKYPNVSMNPGLERALRIRKELEKGRPRDEAVALADAAMGRAPAQPKPSPRPKPAGKSAKVAGRAAHAAKRSR